MTTRPSSTSSPQASSAGRSLRLRRGWASSLVPLSLLLLVALPDTALAQARGKKARATKAVAPAAAAPAAAAPAAPSSPDQMPGEAGPLPTTMDKIASATDIDYRPMPGGHRVKFNLQDADLAELVNHISGMTGRRFIYGAKVRSIKATVVSPEPVTLEEAYQAFLSILEVNGMTVVPQGRFLKIVDSAGVTSQTTPIYERGSPIPATDSFVTRLYRTRFVTPDEAMGLLSKFKSKDGDVSTYTPGNLVILTDTGSNITRMVRILEEIDVGGAGQQMWIEPVNHGDAKDLAARINDLFEVGQGAGGLSRVIHDEQTNSLIVVGNQESYEKLLQVLKRLDSRPGEAGTVHVLPLQHAVANELSKTLQQMLTGRTRGKKDGPDTGDAGGMFEGSVSVTPDEATNALLINSSPRDFAQLRVVVDKLDQPRRQVFIEAVIMDVGVSDGNTLGFSWHGGVPDFAGAGTGTLLTGFDAVKSIAFPADATALQGFAAGVRGAELPNTASLTPTGISIPAFGIVLNALASSGRNNVLATPHIIATDNVAAELQVGENIPLQTNSGVGNLSSLASLTGGNANASAAAGLLSGLGGGGGRQDVGTKIKVTPHINQSDQVRLEIEQESSSAGTPTGTLGVVPITKRTAHTTLVVKDQQTVVIGGLIQEVETINKKKMPILGDIPVLGFIFSSTEHAMKKSNLLLILTPHVIRGQEDLRKIFERKMQERQEFLDRYFVFTTDTWKPPTDYSRLNGLVEDIRQNYFKLDEEERREAELLPREYHEHEPADPIDLPMEVKSPGGGSRPTKAPKAAPVPAPASPGRTQLMPGESPSTSDPLHLEPRPRTVMPSQVAAAGAEE